MRKSALDNQQRVWKNRNPSPPVSLPHPIPTPPDALITRLSQGDLLTSSPSSTSSPFSSTFSSSSCICCHTGTCQAHLPSWLFHISLQTAGRKLLSCRRVPQIGWSPADAEFLLGEPGICGIPIGRCRRCMVQWLACRHTLAFQAISSSRSISWKSRHTLENITLAAYFVSGSLSDDQLGWQTMIPMMLYNCTMYTVQLYTVQLYTVQLYTVQLYSAMFNVS